MISTHYNFDFLLTAGSVIGLVFWENLHHIGLVIVLISGLLGLSFTVSRIVYEINTRYDGSPKKYVTQGFKLKRKPKKTKKNVSKLD